MDKDMFVVVVYDISNDRRRTRLHKRLQDYGTPVQFSVFECQVSKSEYQEMQKAIRKVIKPRLDHIRYYVICKTCRERIEVTGGHEVTKKPAVIVV